MSQKFRVIVADPPWPFSDSLKMSDVKRGAIANYQLMSFTDIKELPVKNIIHPEGSILALWVPSSMLVEGLETMSAWGFTPKQTYIWVKTKKDVLSSFRRGLYKAAVTAIKLANLPGTVIKGKLREFALALSGRPFDVNEVLAFGMGRLFRQTHEICLIGTSDNGIYKKLSNKSQRSVSLEPNLKHSAKPENLQDSLDVMFPNYEKIELFARRQRPGWECIGNEAPLTYGEDIRVSLSKL